MQEAATDALKEKGPFRACRTHVPALHLSQRW
jgi:hypothetical protein